MKNEEVMKSERAIKEGVASEPAKEPDYGITNIDPNDDYDYDETGAKVSAKEVSNLIEDNEKAFKKNRKLKRKVTSKNITILILLVIIIILLLRGCSSGGDVIASNFIQPMIESTEYITKEVEQPEIDYVDIPLTQDINVSEDYPYSTLYNPQKNEGSYYLLYSFYLDGEEEPFYQSNLVEPGYQFSVNFKELLPEGSYNATVVVTSYDMSILADYIENNMEISEEVFNSAECTGIRNNLAITIQ